jgi:3-deoxy-7-phosphoheptulonate synthase
MSEINLLNINVKSLEVLTTPQELKLKCPVNDTARVVVGESRQTVRDILDRKDKRIMVVVGPCSIHDVDAAIQYGQKLKKLADELKDSLFIIMRVYFEKPRTTVGWKGLINDPHINDSFDIEEGLLRSRSLLVELAQMGLPLGTEALDPISPQYLQELISWSAIGARTTESQTHREMASGLSTAVGFKNGTDGNLEVCINAMQSAANPHSFLGINQEGQVAVVRTKGNPYGHVVLRGGTNGPNYDSVHISICEEELKKAKMKTNIMVDCSHANSNKNHKLQPLVLKNVGEQIKAGNQSIIGVMIESNLHEGNQKASGNLKFGVSITDACIDWAQTESILREFHCQIKSALLQRV